MDGTMRRFSFIAVPIFLWAASAAACRSEAPPVIPAAPAASPATPATLQDAVGLWRISAEGETRSCLLALNLNAVNDGHGVVQEDCRRPDLAQAHSWRLTSEGLELRDAEGSVILGLRRRTVDAYEARRGGVAYRMERAPLA